MKIYLAGGESASHRKVMTSIAAQNVALSFIGLSRRIKKLGEWRLDDKFMDDMNIFLDSGAHSINTDDEKYTQGQLADLASIYSDYVKANIDRIEVFSEFDALPLGQEWIEAQRRYFHDLAPEKFMPIWHAESGEAVLREMAEQYAHIGITATSLKGHNLVPTLNAIANSGTQLHGVGITEVDNLYAIKWSSVSSTSWLAPQQWGETHIWTGKTLKRYPKRMKDQARKRYRTYLGDIGFDAELVETDDSTELLRLSAWSWERLLEDVTKKQGLGQSEPADVVTTVDFTTGEVLAQTPVVEVDTTPSEEVKSVVTATRRETGLLPVLGFSTSKEVVHNEDGSTNEVETTELKIRGESNRVCRTCFLASKCPAWDPNSTCAYNIPITLTTRDQRDGLHNSLLEMQVQRVLFMRFAEEQEGGYADPNLSSEIDRLNKMLKTKHDMEQEGFSVTVTAKGNTSGDMGLMSRMFGRSASEKVRALPEPIQADTEIVEAEIVSDWTDV